MAPEREAAKRTRKRICEVAATFGNGRADFLCECGRSDCAATIELAEPQWYSLFSEDESLLLAAEHKRAADGRRVIAENGRFILAETA
jgi:hypothetical protein